jgi:hypothetical protein
VAPAPCCTCHRITLSLFTTALGAAVPTLAQEVHSNSAYPAYPAGSRCTRRSACVTRNCTFDHKAARTQATLLKKQPAARPRCSAVWRLCEICLVCSSSRCVAIRGGVTIPTTQGAPGDYCMSLLRRSRLEMPISFRATAPRPSLWPPVSLQLDGRRRWLVKDSSFSS